MKNQSVRAWLKSALVMVLVSLLAVSAWSETPKRVLVVSVTKGFRHDVIPAADQMLGNLAQKSGKFTVEYVKDEADMAAKMTAAALEKCDGVVFNNTSGQLPLPDRNGFISWIKSGKAFVGLHAATDTLKDYPAFVEMIGASFRTHGPQVEVEVFNQDPKHPAGRSYAASFKVFDEIYLFDNFHRGKVHGLLTMDKHPNTGLPGDYPVSWCKAYGQGKVFYTSLGHRKDVVEKAENQQHVLGGLLWALGLEEGDAAPQSTALKLSQAEIQEGFRSLFNGVDLTGWKLRNPQGRASWSVQNGMLVNEVEKEHGTDLVTVDKFWDFTVRYEFMVPKGANSGFYLRGRYEIQVLDDFASGKPSPHGNGAIYNFAAPSQFASRKAGEWQTAEATIKGNRVTVILNGVKIHDNLAVDRPTGAEIDRNINEPGPIFLQGDHGAVAFRNLRIKVLQ
jgi:type 1 glutamine amidotransferase